MAIFQAARLYVFLEITPPPQAVFSVFVNGFNDRHREFQGA
jgi:hypothetical protein